MKLTKQQQELIKILYDTPGLQLGEIRVKYYINKPNKKRIKQEMKRNSQMSSWLNKLCDKGLVTINIFNSKHPKYNATIKAIELLNKK